MTPRPTPERLAEIRSRLDAEYDWRVAGDVDAMADVHDLLAEVDALTKERDEARATLHELFEIATAHLSSGRNRLLWDLRDEVRKRCRPEGGDS